MPTRLDAPGSLRAVGLMVDGPVIWGTPVRSREAGLFVVETATPSEHAPIDIVAIRTWIERVPGMLIDGEPATPPALAERIGQAWLPSQSVLYVGRTVKALGPRVGAMYATRLGDRRPHPGGHWLRTLKGFEKLRIWWAPTAAAEEYEDGLLAAFAESIDDTAAAKLPAGWPRLPFANLDTVTGEARAHGITASLVDAVAEAAPVVKKPLTRARASAGVMRPPAAPKAPATPRVPSRRPAPSSRGNSKTMTGAPRIPPTRLSQEGMDRMQAELEDLRVVQRPQVIHRVASARALGDLRENADYEAARNEQSFLEGKIRSLEAMLTNAELIDDQSTGLITQGSTVELDIEGGKVTYRIVGSAEASPTDGRISNVSPVGKALLGHKAGDDVMVEMPGRQIHYKVVSVS